MGMATDMVVKSNRLNMAIQNLSLIEIRIIQLAIIDARETETGLSIDTPLVITASRYSEAFEVTRQTAHQAILDAERTLFDRRFTFIDDRDGNAVKSRWLQRVKYLDDQAAIEVCFTIDVVREITRIDGLKQFFTQYLLEQTAQLKSTYSVRLYELLIQWKSMKKTPPIDLDTFREQLGIGINEYQRMGNFKLRVLDPAIEEINEKTDIKTKYKNIKKGRTITGFEFTVVSKNKAKSTKNSEDKRDSDTPDMLTSLKMTDKQRSSFADKLSRMSELSSYSKPGEDYQQFAKRIEDELLDENQQLFYVPYLDKLGFK